MPQDSASVLTDSFIAIMLQDLELSENDQRFLDGRESISLNRNNLSKEAEQVIARSCQEFYIANEGYIHAPGASVGVSSDWVQVIRAGNDLYMTWVGHGVGFWDTTRWNEEHGVPMDEYVKTMGYFGPYIGDDGKIYI